MINSTYRGSEHRENDQKQTEEIYEKSSTEQRENCRKVSHKIKIVLISVYWKWSIFCCQWFCCMSILWAAWSRYFTHMTALYSQKSASRHKVILVISLKFGVLFFLFSGT